MTNDPTSAAVEAAARAICRERSGGTWDTPNHEEIAEARAALAAGLREIAAHPDMRLTVLPRMGEAVTTKPHPTLVRIADAIAARGAGGDMADSPKPTQPNREQQLADAMRDYTTSPCIWCGAPRDSQLARGASFWTSEGEPLCEPCWCRDKEYGAALRARAAQEAGDAG